MLIKNYTTDGTLVIIDGITDVAIPKNPPFGEYALEPWQVFDFENEKRPKSEKPYVITFSKHGPCALKVWNKAYICNDEGRTIERVNYLAPDTVAP